MRRETKLETAIFTIIAGKLAQHNVPPDDLLAGIKPLLQQFLEEPVLIEEHLKELGHDLTPPKSRPPGW